MICAFFVDVLDVVTELAREGVQSELLYADDLVVMSERIKGHRNVFIGWKEIFLEKGL